MRQELAAAGHDVEFVAINAASADEPDDRDALVERCAFPLFQDTDALGIWGLHGGVKDDIFVYDQAGGLAAYLEDGGALSTDLATEAGYENLKQAITDALGR